MFLDAQARAVLFEPPDIYEEVLARYSLSAEDVAFAKAHRRSHNRLGFAIQLALVRDYRALITAASRAAATTERGEPITKAVVEALKDRKLLVPVPELLIRLAMAGRAAAPEGAKLKNLKALVARLDVLRSATISDERRKAIHANRYGIIARDARILHARSMGHVRGPDQNL